MKINCIESGKVGYQIPDNASRDLIDKAKDGLIKLLEPQFGKVDPDQVQFKGNESVIWPDTAMGCPEPHHAYAQVQMAGYKIQFQFQETVYTVHIDIECSNVISPDFIHPPTITTEQIETPSIFKLSATRASSKASDVVEELHVVKSMSLLFADGLATTPLQYSPTIESLTVHTIGGNQRKHGINYIELFPNLKHLTLHGGYIARIDIENIGQHPSLKHLELSNVYADPNDDQIQFFSNLSNLEKLTLIHYHVWRPGHAANSNQTKLLLEHLQNSVLPNTEILISYPALPDWPDIGD